MIHRLCAALALICCIALSACASTEQEQVLAGVGGSTPQDVTTSFLEDFNQALGDTQLATAVRQRYWAERLAGYFAPSERFDQRQGFLLMLSTFAGELGQVESDQKLTVEITFSPPMLVSQQDDHARVRLTDALLHLRVLRTSDQRTIRNREQPFGQTIGQPDGEIPLLRINGRWFLTEG